MGAPLQDVTFDELPIGRFQDVLSARRWREVAEAASRAGGVLAGRTVWNVNSTARGGGVAEMLRSLLGYARGIGVDARWATIGGEPEFFALTKRLHNRLHGSEGDGGPLGDAERELYVRALEPGAAALRERVRPWDLIVLHDPQTAGLIPALRETGARIAWRSHVGYDAPNQLALQAWRFLLPHIRHADVCIFSRPTYHWGGIDPGRLEFIHPSIDAFSPKNMPLDRARVLSILAASGILDARAAPAGAGEPRGRRAEMLEDVRLKPSTPVVLQVSRWDRLKDPAGVMAGFAAHVEGVHLVLAGPAVEAVSDDPEGAQVLAETSERWHALVPAVRERVHLATLPMEDPVENALIVNALQRHARIVCQKSLAEGFGLTVAEAMWKARPLVASRVGGIQDQINHPVDGLLIDDPRDLAGFGAAVNRLLDDRGAATLIGRRARSRARAEFLGPGHLMRYLALFERLLAGAGAETAQAPAGSSAVEGP